MIDAPTLDTMAAEGLRGQLAQLEGRLVDEYGSDRRDAVHRLVAQEGRRFANARVHAFVPILVERAVRSHLTANRH